MLMIQGTELKLAAKSLIGGQLVSMQQNIETQNTRHTQMPLRFVCSRHFAVRARVRGGGDGGCGGEP